MDIVESRLDGLTDELVFTPTDIESPGTTSPDISFSQVYGSGSSFPTIRVWIMKDSENDPSPLSIQFKIPNDFHSDGIVVVDAHLLIDDLGASGDARLQLRADFKGNNEQLGINAGGFADDVESTDFTITEPTLSEALNHQRVSMTLTDSVVNAIEPRDWAFIVLNRAVPSGSEYDNDIYLSSVSFRYPKQ